MEMNTCRLRRIIMALFLVVIFLAVVIFALSRRTVELKGTFSPKAGGGTMPAGESRRILDEF
ncbi:MAG: hypothetical protein WAX69_06450 [Victivallales bacterium]